MHVQIYKHQCEEWDREEPFSNLLNASHFVLCKTGHRYCSEHSALYGNVNCVARTKRRRDEDREDIL